MRDLSVPELEAMFRGQDAGDILLADIPHTRPGYPPHLLFTGKQWESYLGWNAAVADRDRRYGHLRLMAPVLALGRRIW